MLEKCNEYLLHSFTEVSAEEPTLNLDINGKTVPFLVDTGATVSSDLPLSGKEISTVRISGVPHHTPLSAPAIITSAIHPFSTKQSLLLISGSPVNLLARDLLCKMNSKIHCMPKGIFFGSTA